MAACALMIRFDARTGKEQEVEDLLRSRQPPPGSEVNPRYWFSLRMAPEIYGFFATFEQDSDRQVFLSRLAQDWSAASSELLSRPPVTEKVEILTQSGSLSASATLSNSPPPVEDSLGDQNRHQQAKEVPKVGSRDAPGG
jgi:hypothetical protein